MPASASSAAALVVSLDSYCLPTSLFIRKKLSAIYVTCMSHALDNNNSRKPRCLASGFGLAAGRVAGGFFSRTDDARRDARRQPNEAS